MAKDASFDVVSKLEMQEVDNAIHQAQKEIETRFDFKNCKREITRDDDKITLVSDDEYKLTALLDVLQSKFVKRDISLKVLKPGKVEAASGGASRQVFTLQQGIDMDAARQITKLIKDAKLKVQATIQGDQVRVTAKSRDDLQAVIQLLRDGDLTVPVQFVNYR